MKILDDIIKSNIEVYNQARSAFPVISQYENGEISSSIMRSLNLSSFAEFSDFLKRSRNNGFELIIEDMNWRKLKPILIENTQNLRLKKYISNRTQKDFISLLQDAETYDRLLNGRWKRKPKITRRGRLGSGLRSDEHIEGLYKGIIPIINFIIQNEIDVFSSMRVGHIDIPSFHLQDKYNDLRWFINQRLDLSNIPLREIDVTNRLITSFISILDESKIDPRKLNLEYVTNTISEKLRKSMIVPTDTNVRCLRDLYDNSGKKIYSKDQFYSVQSSYISNGSVMIYLRNDSNNNTYVKYLDFEDMSIHRDDLLSILFD